MRTYAFAFLAICAFSACSKDKKDSKLTMKLRNAGASAQSLSQGQHLLNAAGNLSFTPESYKLWINTIVLQNDDGASNQFYMCTSSETDCEVDLADPTSVEAFEARLNAIKVTAGTYTKVWISCSPDSGGYMKVKGHVTLTDGTERYTADPTTNDGASVTSDESKYATLKISLTGGSCGLTMPLAKPLVVGGDSTDSQDGAPEGSTVTMTIFSNLYNQVYYAPQQSSGMGGCVVSPSGAQNAGPGFCSAYPSVFPYFGETTPTVEYYKVANARTSTTVLTEADVNTLVKVIKDETGTPFWASLSNVYVETTNDDANSETGVSGYANSVTKFAVNADESLTIKSMDYGFSAFQRTEHTGEVIGEGVVNGAGTGTGTTYYYKAFPFTP